MLTAYIRMGGSLAILGIVTVSLEFYLALQYQDPPNELWGQATLTIEIEVLFFSQPIELSVERRLAGPSNGQSAVAGGLRVAQLGGGERFSELVEEGDWTEYVEAFAPVTAAPAGTDLRSLTLLSGWSLVGWVGATAMRAEATAGIAGAFDHMFTFDAATQTFRRFSPAAPPVVNTLSEVRSGDGVWIFVPQTATWTQPVASGSLPLSLLSGFNMVAWAGPDNMPVVDALAAIADKLKVAFAYDAQQQRFRSYRPELPTSLNDLSVFREGDGVFLDMNQAGLVAAAGAGGSGGMRRQTITWTALPNGVRGSGSEARLRLTALLTPRLWTDEGLPAPTLSQFPDFLDWPTTALQFEVQFGHAAAGPGHARERPARLHALEGAVRPGHVRAAVSLPAAGGPAHPLLPRGERERVPAEAIRDVRGDVGRGVPQRGDVAGGGGVGTDRVRGARGEPARGPRSARRSRTQRRARWPAGGGSGRPSRSGGPAARLLPSTAVSPAVQRETAGEAPVAGDRLSPDALRPGCVSGAAAPAGPGTRSGGAPLGRAERHGAGAGDRPLASGRAPTALRSPTPTRTRRAG